jgi:uncharacterized protein (DUF58 family)
MVKTFEMDPTSNVWVVLDLQEAVQHGEGDESTEEYCVRIATSIAYKYLQANLMLGLMMEGKEAVQLEPAAATTSIADPGSRPSPGRELALSPSSCKRKSSSADTRWS